MRAYLLREGSRIRVITPYVPDFVSDLKTEIPYYARSFEPEGKCWLIDAEREEEILDVTSRYFDPLFVVTEAEALRRERAAKASTPPPSSSPSGHGSAECLRIVRGVWQEEAELHLLPGAPLSLVEAAWRAMAKLFHPDLVGPGGHTRMVAINRAYETLRKRVGGAA